VRLRRSPAAGPARRSRNLCVEGRELLEIVARAWRSALAAGLVASDRGDSGVGQAQSAFRAGSPPSGRQYETSTRPGSSSSRPLNMARMASLPRPEHRAAAPGLCRGRVYLLGRELVGAVRDHQVASRRERRKVAGDRGGRVVIVRDVLQGSQKQQRDRLAEVQQSGRAAQHPLMAAQVAADRAGIESVAISASACKNAIGLESLRARTRRATAPLARSATAPLSQEQGIQAQPNRPVTAPRSRGTSSAPQTRDLM
jgi:hypothetical protein